MSLQLLLEHGDFKKSRRALVTSASALLVFSNLDLLTQNVEFLSLKLAVNQEALVRYSVIVVIYYLFIFSLRAFEYVSFSTASDPARQLRLLARTLDDQIRTFIIEETLKAIEQDTMRENIGRRSSQNTYELADGCVSLAEEVVEQLSTDTNIKKDHPSATVLNTEKLVEEIVRNIRGALLKRLKRSTLIMYLVEILPPLLVAVISFYFAYAFLK